MIPFLLGRPMFMCYVSFKEVTSERLWQVSRRNPSFTNKYFMECNWCVLLPVFTYDSKITCLLLCSFCGSLWNALWIAFLVASDRCKEHIIWSYMCIYIYVLYLDVKYIIHTLNLYIYIHLKYCIYIYSVHMRFDHIAQYDSAQWRIASQCPEALCAYPPRGTELVWILDWSPISKKGTTYPCFASPEPFDERKTFTACW